MWTDRSTGASYVENDAPGEVYHQDDDGAIVRRADRLVLWDGDQRDPMQAMIVGATTTTTTTTADTQPETAASDPQRPENKTSSPTRGSEAADETVALEKIEDDGDTAAAARQAAARLVQEILEQVAFKDAPPSNSVRETVASPTGQDPVVMFEKSISSSSSSSSTTSGNHSQPSSLSPTVSEDIVPPPPAAGDNSGGSSLQSSSSSSLDKDGKKNSNLSERPNLELKTTVTSQQQQQSGLLGHDGLISLCQWTLNRENGQSELVDETPKEDAPPVEQVDVDTTGAPVQKGPLFLSSSSVSSREEDPNPVTARTTLGPNNINSQKNKPKSRFRLFHRGKKNTVPTSTTTTTVAAGLPPRAPSSHQQSSSALPPLHMFGSEYARHVSRTPLAPSAAAHRRRRSSSTSASPGGGGGRRSISVMGGSAWSRSSGRGTTIAGFCPLHQAEPAVQRGALLDLVVTYGSDPAPPGYYTLLPPLDEPPEKGRHKKSAQQQLFYLHVKMEPVWDKAAQRPCITALTLLHADRNEFVPPGFCVAKVYVGAKQQQQHSVDRQLRPSASGRLESAESKSSQLQQGPPADVGVGVGERLFLAFKRSREGNPITGLQWVRPGAGDVVPCGYTVIEKTPRNHTARLTSSLKQAPMFLSIRQRLANLECLRPLPLVQQHLASLKNESQTIKTATARDQKRSTLLQAYYVTGGHAVKADVGRFHIMDRSTHSLLSPSSVRNRLQLIQESRCGREAPSFAAASDRKHEGDDLDDSVLLSPTASVAQTESFATTDENNESFVSFSYGRTSPSFPKPTETSQKMMDSSSRDSDCSSCGAPVDDMVAEDVSASKYLLTSLLAGSFSLEGFDPSGETAALPTEFQHCVEAFNFIPGIETASSHSDSNQLLDVKQLASRASLLTPILTACYTRHGGAALVAVEGLTALLLKSSFFEDDVDRSDNSDNESSTRLTLLDLSVQVVCDVATTGAQEMMFGSCVEFVENAIRFSQGQLNTRTIGYVLRFYLFVFYFGASSPTYNMSSFRWPNPSRRTHGQDDDDSETSSVDAEQDDMSMLWDPRADGQQRCSLPAAHLAALSLKELISLSIVRLGKVSVSGMLVLAHSKSDHAPFSSAGEEPPLQTSSIGFVLGGILSSVIDDAVDHVEIANYTQLALQQIQRSGGSELFWHEMVNECGLGLFEKDKRLSEAGRDIYIMIFAVMANLVKVSSGRMRYDSSNSDLLPRDISSKLLSLELLLHFLETLSDEQEAVNGMETPTYEASAQSIRTLTFTVRRLVAPALLSNTRAALENPRVFSRLIRILSELWCSPVYRTSCKAEIAILMDLFALRILQLGPQLLAKQKVDLSSDNATVSLLLQQVALINEIKTWFANDPKDVIEFYLNYDTDIAIEPSCQAQLLSGAHLQIFQGLCSGLSNIAEQCGELIGKQIRESQSKFDHEPSSPSTMPSSPTGELADTLSWIRESKNAEIETTAVLEAARHLRKTSLETISEIVKALAISAAAATNPKFTALLLSWTPPDSPIAYEKSFQFSSIRSVSNEDNSDSSGLSLDRSEGVESDGDNVTQFWQEAMANDQKQSLVDSSRSSRHALETALEISETKSLKKAVEYLIACNALSPAPRDIASYLWIHKEKLDPSDLGNYLGDGGSGGVAETEYRNAIRQSYVRAISFNGLNVEEGLRHFLTNCGFRLPGEAQKIDRILNTFAICYYEDNAGDIQRCPFKGEDVVFVLSFAVIMLNTDLHKATSGGGRKTKRKMTKAEFVNNLRGIAQGEDIDREYICSIFDSIQENPIEMHDGDSLALSSAKDRHHVLRGMLKNVRSADALLRSLAVHDFNFVRLEDFADDARDAGQRALSDLTRSCIAKTWYQWHGVVETGLEMAHLDPQGMYPSVEILLYALSLSVCLGMSTERAAFMSQLGRLKAFEERREGWVRTMDCKSFRNDDWYIDVEDAAAGTEDRRIWALREIYSKIQSLQSALLVDVQNKAGMTKAVSQLKDGDFLLLDPARSFVRSADLVKKSGRTGRTADYRFFLFSDVLLYGHQEPDDGRYSIHGELPLHLMKVVDWFPPSQRNRQVLFEVHHPRKSFQVLCTSVEERKSWVEDIRSAISLEIHHKMKQEAAQLAVYTHG